MSTETMTEIPAGYRQDRFGNLVPKDKIKPIDKARDKLITDIARKAAKVSGAISEFKAETFEAVADFVATSAEQYGAKHGGAKGNMTLFSFDGRYKLQIAVNEHRTFDERLQVAKTLVDECIHEWMKGSNKNIQALVDHAFQVDRQGRVSVERILGLRRLDIDDGRWKNAMDAIADAIQIAGSKRYLRLYERIEGTDEYRPLPLDVANA